MERFLQQSIDLGHELANFVLKGGSDWRRRRVATKGAGGEGGRRKDSDTHSHHSSVPLEEVNSKPAATRVAVFIRLPFDGR
jgi:hypothetical protein